MGPLGKGNPFPDARSGLTDQEARSGSREPLVKFRDHLGDNRGITEELMDLRMPHKRVWQCDRMLKWFTGS